MVFRKEQMIFVRLLFSSFLHCELRSLRNLSLAALAAGTQPELTPTRIISLIPAVTEMLFAIGAGPQVVAVGSFDRYPPEVEKLPSASARSSDPDVERILSLRPDLVAIYGSQTNLREQDKYVALLSGLKPGRAGQPPAWMVRFHRRFVGSIRPGGRVCVDHYRRHEQHSASNGLLRQERRPGAAIQELCPCAAKNREREVAATNANREKGSLEREPVLAVRAC